MKIKEQYFYTVYRYRGLGEQPKGMCRYQWCGPFTKQQVDDYEDQDDWIEAISGVWELLPEAEQVEFDWGIIDDQYDRLIKPYSRLGKNQRKMLRNWRMLPEQQMAPQIQAASEGTTK